MSYGRAGARSATVRHGVVPSRWLATHATTVGLLAICVVAAAVRVATIDVQSFDDFEAFTVALVRMGYGKMIHAIPSYEATPPLYYTLAWLWARVGGTGEAWLRSLSAIASIATVPVVYLAARTLSSARTALVAAGALALSPAAVWYAQEARAYGLLSFVLALALLFLVREVADVGSSSRNIAGWSLAAALAMATHYFAALVIVPEGIWLAVRARASPRRRLVLLWPVVVAGSLLPLAGSQVSHAGGGEPSQTPLPVRVLQTVKQLSVGFNLPAEVPITACALVLCSVAAYAGATTKSRGDRRLAAVGALITAAAVMLLLLLALSGWDYFLSRYLTVALVPAVLVVGAGIASLPRKVSLLVAIALALTFCAAIAGATFSPIGQRPDYRDSLGSLPPPSRGGRVVIISSNGTHFEIFLHGARSMPATGTRVRELDVVGLDVVGNVHTRPHPAVALVPAGFVLRSSHTGASFTTLVYTASTPVQVRPALLLFQRALGLDQTSMFYQLAPDGP